MAGVTTARPGVTGVLHVGSWLFVVTSSVAAAHIYTEDTPRVTASRNRLGLSLTKRIRHGLIAKINDKRRSWTCEALGQISVDYSRACRAHVCFSIFSLLHTFVSA
jgi:hypothetical protein